MRLFCHISEFQDGMDEGTTASPYSLIPLMMLSAESTTLWAPSPRQLSGAHRFDGKALGWHDLLDLIKWAVDESDRPRLRVIAREPWLIDPKCLSRQNAPSGEWFDEFDSEIKTLYEIDSTKEPEKRRVDKVPPAKGDTWATDQVERRTEAFGLAEERYKQQRLPPGFLQKAERCVESTDKRIGGGDARIWSVLKDARNHQDAIALAGADFPVEPSLHSDAIQALYPRPEPAPTGSMEQRVSTDSVRNALEIAHSLSRDRGVAEWFELLKSKYVQRMRNELQELMLHPKLGGELLEQFRRASQAPALSEVLRPQDWVEAAGMYGGLAYALACLIYAALCDGSKMGLWLAGAGVPFWSFELRRLYQKVSWAPLDGNKGAVFPYLLGYDSAKQTYRGNRELADKLERAIVAGEVS